ncbi:hypothetical protein XF24_00403 [candidate division SR1 bacterium Aalborg_AAW-1]|nr:hypothetical protein XF24_00403 [candidate division SR1 bacterium Aalborg_AAW-1]
MNQRPLLKKIVSQVTEKQALLHILEVTKNLIIIMKKFGKQLSEPSLYNFVKDNYPEEYQLYELLGGSARIKIKDCQLLQQYLREAIGSEFLVVTSSHTDSMDSISKLAPHSEISLVGDTINPLLIASSSDKIYRRSLQDDLKKLGI